MFGAEDIVLWSTALAAIAALAAAIAAFFQGRLAREANLATVFLGFTSRYDDPKITNAINALTSWRKRAGAGFAETWVMKFEQRDALAVELNGARRDLNRYFDDIALAYDAGILGKRLARVVAAHYGLLVYFDIAVPMNRALLRGDFPDRSKILRKIGAKYNGRTALGADIATTAEAPEKTPGA